MVVVVCYDNVCEEVDWRKENEGIMITIKYIISKAWINECILLASSARGANIDEN